MKNEEQNLNEAENSNSDKADVSGSGLFDRRPHCQCLYEIENKLPRTKFCFMACRDQFEILRQREKK